MCELLGLNFNIPVNPKLSFSGFRLRGKKNPDGWGLGWYPDNKNSLQLIKEAFNVNESSLADFIENYSQNNIHSTTIIGHVRYSTVGNIAHENTHPFHRELNGKEFVFAHNGNIKNFKEFKLQRFFPIGETDSEHLFCYILDQFNKEKRNFESKQSFRQIWDLFKHINEFGVFNCLLSNGKYLFAYRDINGLRKLHWVYRKPPYTNIELKDRHYSIKIEDEDVDKQEGVIIATRPLTVGENWQEFDFGELKIFKDGVLLFSSEKIDITKGNFVKSIVYEAPDWMEKNSENIVGLPYYVRKALNIQEEDEVLIKNLQETLSLKVTVKKTSKDMIRPSKSEAEENHILVPKRIRTKLNLKKLKTRNTAKFKSIYGTILVYPLNSSSQVNI